MLYKHQFSENSTQNSLSCKLLKNLSNLDEFYRYLNFEKWKIWSIFQNYKHIPDRCGLTKNAIEKNNIAAYSAHIELTKKHKVGFEY